MTTPLTTPKRVHAGAAGGDIETVDIRSQPFRYFLAVRCVTTALERALLAWFEGEAPWRLVQTDFYEQYQFSLLDTTLPPAVSPLATPEAIAAMRAVVAVNFHVALDDRTRLVAHKLLSGQRIAIHNDYLAGEETHRLVVQLNRGLRTEAGGFFLLFNSLDPRDVHRILRPVSRSGLGFEIGKKSNHAVSRLHEGERYTLVYSFFAAGSAHGT